MEQTNFIRLKDSGLRKLFWFFIASSALVTAGYCVSNVLSTGAFLLVFWINIVGIFLIYRMNEFFVQHGRFLSNLIRFLKHPLHLLITLQLVVIVIPLSILLLPRSVFFTMGAMGVVGALYCVNFRILGSNFRLKDFFLLKNLMIGGAWGALVLIGGAVTDDPLLMRFFFIAAAQVTIGGIIRDIPDEAHDRKIGVKTLPVVLGVKQTMRFLHVFNAAILFMAVNYPIEPGLLVFAITLVSWRALNLWLLQRNKEVRFYSQWMNLFTCAVFLIVIVILTQNGTL